MKIEVVRYMILGIISGICVCIEGSLNSVLGKAHGDIKVGPRPIYHWPDRSAHHPVFYHGREGGKYE